MAKTEHEGALYVVEDDVQVRDMLAKIGGSIGLSVQAFARADELLGLSRFDTPGVVLLDLRLPGLSGLEAFRHLRERRCNLPVVFLTGFGDVPTVAQAMKAGAFDFLEKPFRQQELVDVLQAALAQHAALAQREERRKLANERLAALSVREREVVPYLVEGWISKRIALELGVSKKAIDLHRSNVLKKAGVGSIAELVRLVVDAADPQLLAIPSRGKP